MNQFALNPTNLDISRSIFKRNSQHKTSLDAGYLVPIYIDAILPGDTVTLDMAEIIRGATPIAPVLDNSRLDVFWFFVPNRLVWDHWKQFMGENDSKAWTQTDVYQIPSISSKSTGIDSYGSSNAAVQSLADYFGIPIDSNGCAAWNYLNTFVDHGISVLPFRAYYQIWNDWFRDQNTQPAVLFSKGDVDTGFSFGGNTLAVDIGSKPGLYESTSIGLMKAAKTHDLFTSCLPGPQKGAAVQLPLGDYAPIVGKDDRAFSVDGIQFFKDTQAEIPAKNAALGTNSSGGLAFSGSSFTGSDIKFTNAVADLANATAATVSQIRLAFQTQKYLEKNARGGTRYIEWIKSHFGVTSPDARMQRSELLGETSININIDQVVSTTNNVSEGGSASNLLGTTGAFSKTAGKGSSFTKSFVEHGYLIGLAVIRHDHTYSQGIEKDWFKKDVLDLYDPVFANISEVAVKNQEIFIQKDNTNRSKNTQAFGFQEAWYEYRYKPSRCSGYLNPSSKQALTYWTYADDFSALPVLNDDFISETNAEITRTLAVGSTAPQYVCDFYFRANYARAMPVHSVPGLIDHH